LASFGVFGGQTIFLQTFHWPLTTGLWSRVMMRGMKTIFCSLLLWVSQLYLWAGPNPDAGYVAHEWGTFTSVQGADGIALEWNPLVTAELPGFVHDRGIKDGVDPVFLSKSAFPMLQRMETPVIYFYSDQERTVDVAVNFPQGIVTEWYPQTTRLATNDTRRVLQTKGKALHWDALRVLPRAQETAKTLWPLDKSGSHYYAARETDADLVGVQAGPEAPPEHERFLFYRGVGSFTAPLQVRLSWDEQYVHLTNAGSEGLTHLFVLSLHPMGAPAHLEGKFIYVDHLDAGESKTVELRPSQNQMELGDLRPRLMERMQHALVQEGLYEREAVAMVKTWEDSWFGEQGLRVLYVLPRVWTDRILPLQLQPAPRALERVMVGRAEMVTPTMEWQLLKQVVKFSESDETTRPTVVAETRQLGLGRFAEPTLRRILGKTPNPQFSEAGWGLVQAAAKPGPAAKGLAAK
jgi:hypothetical protein